MILPNPVPLAAAKFLGYAALAHVVRRRGTTRGNVWLFSAIRVFLGWAVGAGLAVGLWGFADAWGDAQGPIYYAILTVPRFLLWAVLIHWWFRPVGGNSAALLWAGVGTGVSTAIDVVFLCLFEHVPFLGLPFC